MDELDIDELLGAYALNAVEAHEVEVVEEYLARSPRARAEVRDHHDVAAWLGNTAGDRPRNLWASIEARLETPFGTTASSQTTLFIAETTATGPSPTRPSSHVPSIAEHRVRTSQRPRVATYLATATALAAAVIMGALMINQNHRLDRQADVVARQSKELETQRGALDSQRTELVALTSKSRQRELDLTKELDVLRRASEGNGPRLAKLIESPDTREAVLISSNGKRVARIYLSKNGEGYLVGSNLPALTADKTYQLWAKHDEVVLSLGVLGNAPRDVQFTGHGSFTTFMLTTETQSGVATSSQPAVAVGEIAL